MSTTEHRFRGRATSAFGRDVLLLALLLTFGVIGWWPSCHSFVRGFEQDHVAVCHLAHPLRDSLLALPLAVVAVAAGLRIGRRYGTVARAGLISAAFGLLLVPSVRLHDVIDGALSGEN